MTVLALPIIYLLNLVSAYTTKACHEIPNQYMRAGMPMNSTSSLLDRSAGILLNSCVEKPNSRFTHDLKKNVGPRRYKNRSKVIARRGNKSTKNEKNKNSDTKNMEPGKPRNINKFTSEAKNSLGHKKFRPPNSVISLVLNLRAIASTSKKELVDNRACAISIQKLASSKLDWPLTTQIVSQCISTTVEYATNFFKSIW